MLVRALPALLVATALAGDGRLRLYLLLAAVPAAGAAGLAAYGRLVELPGRAPGETAARVDALLGAIGLLLVLVAAAFDGRESMPGLAPSACVVFLGVSALQAVAGLRTGATRPRPAPAR